MQQFMEFVTWVANGFMSLFQAGGETFLGWVTGIIPMVVCLMTAINSIIKLIGEDRVERFAKKITGNVFGRYLLLPVLAVLFLGNPMCYSFGRFVDEKYKPAYYDSCVSFAIGTRRFHTQTLASCSFTWALAAGTPSAACRSATSRYGILQSV